MLRRGLPRSVRVLVLFSLLGGCMQLPSIEGVSPQRPPRAAIQAYTLSGRISVRQGEQLYAANIVWRHDAQHDEIMLSTPLGQGIAELTRNAAGAHLTTADRHEYTASDLAGLSDRVFGVALPLSALPRWVLGDAPDDATLDIVGRPQRFVADHWHVDYLDYEGAAAYALPQLVDLKRGDIDLRLKIDEWQMVR